MINVNIKNRYSNNYIGSAYTNDPYFDQYLAEAKATFKAVQAASSKKLRLVKRGDPQSTYLQNPRSENLVRRQLQFH